MQMQSRVVLAVNSAYTGVTNSVPDGKNNTISYSTNEIEMCTSG